MKQPINMILATLVLLWSVNATAFDLDDINRLISKAKIDSKSSKVMDRQEPETHLEFTMYPKAFQWTSSQEDKPTCLTWLAYGSQKKVADSLIKSLKKEGHSVSRYMEDWSGAYAGQPHKATVLTINEKHWCGKTPHVSTYTSDQLENCRKLLPVRKICAKAPESEACKKANKNISEKDALASEYNPYERMTIDAKIFLDSVKTKKGEEFFQGLMKEVNNPYAHGRHTMAEYHAMEKKYGYLKSMYYPDNYDAKLLKEYKAKTRSGQRENVMNHHPDAATAKASATDMQKTMQDLQASGASPQELVAAMMQYQMQNQQNLLAQGRQVEALHDVEMTDYWNDWVEFLEKLAKKGTYATRIKLNAMDGTLSIKGVSSCQNFK